MTLRLPRGRLHCLFAILLYLGCLNSFIHSQTPSDVVTKIKGISLLPPKLVSSTTRDIWVGAAVEEKFYRSITFSQKYFAPPAHQMHEMMKNCGFDQYQLCIEQIAGNLGLAMVIDIQYERRQEDFYSQIKILKFPDTSASLLDSFQYSSKDPILFATNLLVHIYTLIGGIESEVEKKIKIQGSQNQSAYGSFALGYRYLQERDFKKAFYPFLRALELDPNFQDPILYLAEAYLLNQEKEKASLVLEKIPESKGDWNFDLIRAQVLLSTGKSQQALNSIRRAKESLPGNNHLIEYVQGLYSKSVGSYTRAISYYIAAINLNPTVLEYYLELGQMVMSRGEPKLSLPYFEKAVQYSLGNPKYRLQYSIALRQSKDYHTAIQTIQEILKQYPSYYPARIQLGISFYELGWIKKSRNAFQANIDLKQDTLNSLLNLAVLEVNEGYIAEARGILEKIISLYPNSLQALINMGLLEVEYGSYKKGQEYFLKALEFKQTDTTALLGLATAEARLGNSEGEYATLNRVLEVDPENITALTRLSDKALQKKDFTEAVNFLQEIIDIRPMSYRQRISLAKALFRLGENESAQQQLRFIEINFSNSSEIQYELAESYFLEGMYSRAILAVEPLLSANSRDYRYPLLLAKSYTQQIIESQSRRIDAKELALKNFLLAVELNPTDWETYFWMGRYQRRVVMNNKSSKKFLGKALELAKKTYDKEQVKVEMGLLTYF